MDDGDRIVFLPIGKEFIEDDGTISLSIMPDALHLSPAGYKRWAVAIEPTLSQMLAAQPLKQSTQ
jgi:lysophospholipase L1-like esterase